MTDKQIIVDGVDVSGCQYYKIPQNEMYPMSNFCGLPCNGFCKNDPKCSYKQWKRKEQECEELSFDNFDLKDQLTDLKFKYKTINDVAKSFEQKLQAERKQLDQLKAENEELEKELRQKKMTILMNNDHYFEVDQENKKLKQTLTEIKNKLTVHKTLYYESKLIEKLHKEILQKISEVEDESNN